MSVIVEGSTRLSEIGAIVERSWLAIPEHFPHVTLDAFVIMPNHIHGIVVIQDSPHQPESTPAPQIPVRATHASPEQHPALPQPESTPAPQIPVRATHASPRQHASPEQHASPRRDPRGADPGSLGAIIGSFKSATTREINRLLNQAGIPFWHRNYYERIVRDDQELERIRRYIEMNPIRVKSDHTSTR